MKKEINQDAQIALMLNEKIQNARKNPFSEHNMAMTKLQQLQKQQKKSPGAIPIYDRHGHIIG